MPDTFVWVGQSKSNNGAYEGWPVNAVETNLLDGSTGGADFGTENYLTHKNYWNNKQNWMLRVNHGASGYYNECGTGGDGTQGTYLYVPADRWPGQYTHLDPLYWRDEVIFESLPNAPQDGLCDGPYPKSECLFGGPSGGAFDTSKQGAAKTYRRERIQEIIVKDSYFDADQTSSGCSGAPLERLRLGMDLNRVFGGTTGDNSSLVPGITGPVMPHNTGTSAPGGTAGYRFTGLALRADYVHFNSKQTNTDYDLDQTKVILTEPYNNAGTFTIDGSGSYVVDASKSLTGANNGTVAASANRLADSIMVMTIKGSESENPTEGLEPALSASAKKKHVRYNKSLTVKYTAGHYTNCSLAGGKIQKFELLPSKYYYTNDQHIFNGGPEFIHCSAENNHGKDAITIGSSSKVYFKAGPSNIHEGQSTQSLSVNQYLLKDTNDLTTGTDFTNVLLDNYNYYISGEGAQGNLRVGIATSSLGVTGGDPETSERRTLLRYVKVEDGLLKTTDHQARLYLLDGELHGNGEVDFTEKADQAWTEILGHLNGTTSVDHLPFGVDIAFVSGAATGTSANLGLQLMGAASSRSISLPGDGRLAYRPNYSGVTGSRRAGFDKDRATPSINAGLSSSPPSFGGGGKV